MTKSEFNEKFNRRYNELLQPYKDVKTLKSYLSKSQNENQKISTEELCIDLFMLSIELNKKLIHSVLIDTLEFSD